MKKLIILMSLSLVIVFTTVGLAGSSKTRQITGSVSAINTSTSTITVKKKNKEIVISLEEKTNIIRCTKGTAITDIKIGDKVTARYKVTADKNTAKSIIIKESSGIVD